MKKVKQTETDAEMIRRIVKNLTDLRKTQGLSQREVGKRMGISQSGVANLEKRLNNAQITTLQGYARVIGYPIKIEIDYPE